MRVMVAAVGRIKERGLRELIDDYGKRIGRYAKFDEIELEDGNAADVRARFEKAIPARSRVVALEVHGKRMSSPDLSKFVERCEVGAVPTLAFLIGGSYGLPKELARDVELSLSDMILPHRLARLFLVEQIYRAFTISRNEPYSH